MKPPTDLTEQELRELRKYFEPFEENYIKCHTPFDKLCNGLLKATQLFIDKLIIEKANSRSRGY